MSAYPQAGAGPSFYQHSPPPHHVYGNPSPGPRPNYQYSYPVPPPHLNSHQPPQFQQSPSRGNHRHNAGGGGPIYTSRGAPQYHNYHPTQQHQFLQSHVSPPQLGLHPQQQQQQQHIPFSPQSAKYNHNQPFSPPYHYPSPNAPVFTPSWQSQQPISPLPKQLSMPPPQAFHEPSLASPPGLTQSSQSPVAPVLPSSENEDNSEPLAPAPSTPTPTPASFLEPASDPPPGSPVLSQAPYTSTYSHMGTISTSDTVTLVSPQSSPKSLSHTLPPVVNPIAKWAIWSRRPHDPSHAPSIIISPRARPPPDVVQQALDLRTPPHSQPSSPSQSTTILPVVVEESIVVEESVVVEESLVVTQETVGTAEEEDDASTPQPGEDVESSSSVTSSSVVGPIQTSTPSTPAPSQEVPLAPATVKKLWADLLRTSTSTTSSSTASPSSGPAPRNTLPTSSVMGFSIPAGSTNPIVPVSPSKKSELIALLTTGPNPNSTTGTIRPRGIVNSGNMCYANSVLQLLVYCTPFQRLFAELGKILSGSAVTGSSGSDSLVNGSGPSTSSSASTSTPINGLNGKEKDKDAIGMTPLVDATVEFLREFLDDRKTKSKTKKQVHSKKGSVLVNGTGSGSGVTSKGKEKETLLDGVVDDDSIGDVDWEACDSFLPTYVYDAMKLKKRFDHMRGGHQEDAEEFFGFYLETLEEELLSLLHAVNPPKSTKTDAAVEEKEEAAPPEDDGWMEVGKRNRTVITRTIKATESPITRIFSGRFRTTVRAPGQKDSATVDYWNLLRLDIQRDHIHTVQDALSGLSQAQSVQLTQSTRPGVIIEGQQQSLIEVLPPILVLQLKRFGYDTMGVAKVGKQVRFGSELEIGHDLMVPAAKKAHPPKYKLFGVLYHHGFSASGGHYTLDVLHPNRYPGSVNAKSREGWVRIDDELVSDVRHDNVFEAYERDDARCLSRLRHGSFPNPMSGDSDSNASESFSQTVRNSIFTIYGHRCVICLNHYSTTQCALIIDATSTLEQNQLRNAIKLGILHSDYQGNASENGIILCPNCHAYFTQNLLVLSLPIPVLVYLRDYVRDVPKASQKPLCEVFDLLLEASRGTPVELPDAKPIFPYLGLFTLVTLNPTPIIGNMIITLFLPPLSVIRGKKFVKARSNTSLTSTSKNVARIFDPLALDDNLPLNAGAIPISPADKAFEDKRYWKIPVHSAAVFAALINRLQYDSSGCKDIRLAGTIYHTLGLQSIDEYLSDENSGNGGPNGGGGPNDGNDDNEGGGPSKGGRSFKRKGAGGKRSGKGIKKARKMSGGSETRACGESGEFPTCAQNKNRRSNHCEIASSMCIPNDALAHSLRPGLIKSGCDDSENGLSVSAQSPQNEDNPAEWQFGPSFSTNKIVFTARGIKLT